MGMNHPFLSRIAAEDLSHRFGYVRRVTPSHIEATGPLSTVGDICEIDCHDSSSSEPAKGLFAEVVAVEAEHVVLIPLETSRSVYPDARVTARPSQNLAPVGNYFAGRVVDALARPLDMQPPVDNAESLPLAGEVMAPMERVEPTEILETGLRVMDGMLPIGRGQRIGVFAASGVGKTTLIQQLARQIDCDRCVLCLVGERGRKVETLWRDLSALQDAERFSCVAATSDISAALRARAVSQALCLAEYWRSKGEHVLLIVDSVTRLAMALREIGLAAGAPPTLRAYTPNVFAALPRIVERCGGRKAGGSITAIMTVLSETDQVDDPIVELMKSLLDGHIVLSRQLAEHGHFPAIDVSKSVSRQSDALMSETHASAAMHAARQLAVHEEARVMIESGIYKSGSNIELDDAISNRALILAFLQQKRHLRSGLSETLSSLASLQSTGVVP